MATWRCPHCGTPQSEAARCWVCRRSSTICSTCRHFRASLAASVGYCGLDRRRAPLRGTEHRGCWTSEVSTASVTTTAGTPSQESLDLTGTHPHVDAAERAVARLRPDRRATPGVLEGFVPIELAGRGPRALRPVDAPRLPSPPPAPDIVESWADRETLFGDP